MIRLILFLTFFAFPACAENLFKAESFVLDNGLQVIAIENHRAPVVSHMVWYKTGSIDDPQGKSGIAHLLEHMMFKGTPAVPDGEFSKIVARNGGQENAFTSYDFTAYYQNIARDRLELVMFLEADRMKNLRFSEKDFTPELEVVKEERLMRYDNDPAMLLAEQRNKLLWGDHVYSRPIIGIKKELAALTLKDAQTFYETHYAPDNAVLIVAGDITAEELKPLAEKYYGKLAPSRKALSKRSFTPSYPLKSKIEMAHPQVKIRTLTRTYIVPSYLSEKKEYAHAYAVLAEILGAPNAGILYKRLINTKKASSAGAFYNGFSLDRATFTLSAVAHPGTPLAEIESILDKPFEINEKSLKKAKKRLVSGMEYLTDDPETTANVLGKAAVLGMTAQDLENWPNKINAVTLDEVRAAFKSMIAKAPVVTTFLTPETPQ